MSLHLIPASLELRCFRWSRIASRTCEDKRVAIGTG
jgi:hypothetical protein